MTHILEPDGGYRYVSPSYERLLGYALGGHPFDWMRPADISHARDELTTLVRTPGVVRTVEHRMRHADGSWRTLESIAQNRLDGFKEVNDTWGHDVDDALLQQIVST